MSEKELSKIAQELSKMNNKIDRLIAILAKSREQLEVNSSSIAKNWNLDIGSTGDFNPEPSDK